jgi:hypothetical protein
VDYAVRFIAGGPDCFRFAILGGVLRPNSFAGLFSAAPSVALVTLSLALVKHGPNYVNLEGRSMVLGAGALALYSFAVCQLLMRFRWSAQRAWRSSYGWQSRSVRSNCFRLRNDGARKMIGAAARPLVRVCLAFCSRRTGDDCRETHCRALGAGGWRSFSRLPGDATATLIEKHERERKQNCGLAGHRRGSDAAGLDAAVQVLDSLGLFHICNCRLVGKP